MSETEITTRDRDRAVREWFDAFGSLVAAEEYGAARALVADDVVSFGTKAELVDGLDHLVDEQWRGIWPNIEDFSFEEVRAGGEGDHAWGVATWTSTGFDEAGDAYHRPGRATVSFERREGRWLAVHTHFSLYPGTPRPTHGPGGRAE